MASKKKSNRARTYARNRTVVSRKGYENVWETDGVYLLKLIATALAGLLWLRLASPVVLFNTIPIGALPVGALVALVLIASLEKAQFNRKIMYALLVVVTIVGFFVDAGVVI